MHVFVCNNHISISISEISNQYEEITTDSVHTYGPMSRVMYHDVSPSGQIHHEDGCLMPVSSVYSLNENCTATENYHRIVRNKIF